MRRVRFLALVGVLMTAAFFAACGDDGSSGSGPVDGAKSPEALIEGLQAAAAAEDYRALAALVVPGERPAMALGMFMAINMGAEFAAAGEDEEAGKAYKAAVDAVTAKHGLADLDMDASMGRGDDEAAAAKALAGKDVPALLADAMAVVNEHRAGKDDRPGPLEKMQGKVEDLKVEGDKATVELGGQDMTLRKIDDRWYASMK